MLLPQQFFHSTDTNHKAILFSPCGLHVNHADTGDVCILAVANILSYVHDDKDEQVTFPLTSAVVVATSSLALWFRFFNVFWDDSAPLSSIKQIDGVSASSFFLYLTCIQFLRKAFQRLHLDFFPNSCINCDTLVAMTQDVTAVKISSS